MLVGAFRDYEATWTKTRFLSHLWKCDGWWCDNLVVELVRQTCFRKSPLRIPTLTGPPAHASGTQSWNTLAHVYYLRHATPNLHTWPCHILTDPAPFSTSSTSTASLSSSSSNSGEQLQCPAHSVVDSAAGNTNARPCCRQPAAVQG